MKTHRKISNRFRELLKQELEAWQSDGVISSEQSALITQKYQLDQIRKESTHLMISAIYIIGTILIGGGIISFVAAHWEQIPLTAKITLIVAAMLMTHFTGFYLWKADKSRRLGHALIVLGTLIFGANIGLLAQIFHIKSNFYNGFYAWAIGAVIMAYAIESVPNVIIAIIISFAGFCGWAFNQGHRADSLYLSFCYYPFVAAIVFLPFSHLCRSAFTFSMSLLAIGLAAFLYTFINFYGIITLGLVAGGAALLFFAYGLLLYRTTNFNSFVPSAMVTGAFFAALGAYLSSFHSYEYRFPDLSGHNMWLIMIICFYAMAVIMWGITLKGALINVRTRLMSLSILISCILISVPMLLPPDSFFYALCGNIACLILSAGFIACSFRLEDRRVFWAGVLFAALVITSRFFEYDTGLLIKAVVFITCGIGLILAGVGFENYLRKRRLVNE
jgi:uncharacterized membrane protein